jgi:hypothetical protein
MKISPLREIGLNLFGPILLLGIASDLSAQMTTAQVDNARTGANLNEVILSPRNVNAQHFGKLTTFRVDGDVYAQPLFVPGVQIPGKGKHDVIYVATEHDSIYAFDAYGSPSTPLWHVSFLPFGVTTIPERDVQCFFISPEVGITSTQVIDLKTGTLYVLARTKTEHLFSANEYHQQLHALAITTGVEKFGGPVEIKAVVSGRGDGSANGKIAFDPLRENPRAALLLSNGIVYLSWASSCDVGPYHGWVIAYDDAPGTPQGLLLQYVSPPWRRSCSASRCSSLARRQPCVLSAARHRGKVMSQSSNESHRGDGYRFSASY